LFSRLGKIEFEKQFCPACFGAWAKWSLKGNFARLVCALGKSEFEKQLCPSCSAIRFVFYRMRSHVFVLVRIARWRAEQ
jgi:ribosomal protein S27AE